MSSPTTSPGQTSLARSQEFWFDDGSIVLQVEETQFRVHRSLLCAGSNVFRDMSEYPQPASEETLEGCPVIILHHDTTVDWTNLLKFIYSPAQFLREGAHLPFPFVASMLRLGNKYGFADVRAAALNTIRIQVPSLDLDDWDNIFNPRRRFSVSDSGRPALVPRGCIPGDWILFNAFNFLNLAIEQHLNELLPIAYYICIHEATLEHLLTGMVHADGSRSAIRKDALTTVLMGRAKLQHAYLTETMEWLRGHLDVACCAQVSCEQARVCNLEELANFDPQKNGGPLRRLEEGWLEGYCKPCTEEILRLNEAHRRLIWEDLPAFFGLPRWQNLGGQLSEEEQMDDD